MRIETRDKHEGHSWGWTERRCQLPPLPHPCQHTALPHQQAALTMADPSTSQQVVRSAANSIPEKCTSKTYTITNCLRKIKQPSSYKYRIQIFRRGSACKGKTKGSGKERQEAVEREDKRQWNGKTRGSGKGRQEAVEREDKRQCMEREDKRQCMEGEDNRQWKGKLRGSAWKEKTKGSGKKRLRGSGKGRQKAVESKKTKWSGKGRTGQDKTSGGRQRRMAGDGETTSTRITRECDRPAVRLKGGVSCPS
ncbi:hypothetical protein Pmani_027933 [Petrolisthes manimaculis]|uniref:Uncharacterized protein n=1 Tax=Petrolisthes manimaculis TaxID=1843537 RepID=A0AAE1TW07_9EUCA|nr:hypothetical protein Pmani_027933 [Petrolisthes manimaculis]